VEFCLTVGTLAAVKGDRTLAQLAEQFDVHPNQVTTWKAQLEGSAAAVFGPGSGNVALSRRST
jgi:transposase-like protein